MPAGHPGMTSPAADKLDEAETAALTAIEERKAAAEAAAAAPPKVPWAASCQSHQKCAEPPPIPDCKENVIAHNWDELEYNAAKAAGQTIDVEGPLALSPMHAVSPQKCPPGVCCHKLDMNVVLDGRPDALALPGFTCHGDDSGMCCNVPANGQLVTATGTLKKAPPGSPLKWQLTKASFCIGKISQPTKPSMGPG